MSLGISTFDLKSVKLTRCINVFIDVGMIQTAEIQSQQKHTRMNIHH